MLTQSAGPGPRIVAGQARLADGSGTARFVGVAAGEAHRLHAHPHRHAEQVLVAGRGAGAAGRAGRHRRPRRCWACRWAGPRTCWGPCTRCSRSTADRSRRTARRWSPRSCRGRCRCCPGCRCCWARSRAGPGPPQADTQLSGPAVLPQTRPVWQRAWPPAVGQQFWLAPPQGWQRLAVQVLPGSQAVPAAAGAARLVRAAAGAAHVGGAHGPVDTAERCLAGGGAAAGAAGLTRAAAGPAAAAPCRCCPDRRPVAPMPAMQQG